MAQNSLSNFGRELPKEHSCETISKSVHRFSRSHLKLFSIYSPGTILFNGAEPFEQYNIYITIKKNNKMHKNNTNTTKQNKMKKKIINKINKTRGP